MQNSKSTRSKSDLRGLIPRPSIAVRSLVRQQLGPLFRRSWDQTLSSFASNLDCITIISRTLSPLSAAQGGSNSDEVGDNTPYEYIDNFADIEAMRNRLLDLSVQMPRFEMIKRKYVEGWKVRTDLENEKDKLSVTDQEDRVDSEKGEDSEDSFKYGAERYKLSLKDSEHKPRARVLRFYSDHSSPESDQDQMRGFDEISTGEGNVEKLRSIM